MEFLLVKKKSLRHKINNFIADTLETIIHTTLGTISIATAYLPSRRPYSPFPDFHKLLYSNNPAYILGDLNARHTLLGSSNNNNNAVGRGLKVFRHTFPNISR